MPSIAQPGNRSLDKINISDATGNAADYDKTSETSAPVGRVLPGNGLKKLSGAALKGAKKKVQIYVPGGKLRSYKKLFTGKGIKSLRFIKN